MILNSSISRDDTVGLYSSYNYDLLHFIPTKIKDDFTPGGKGYEWAANNVNYLVQECVDFISEKESNIAKLSEMGEILEQQYINIIDPPDKATQTGGKAEFFYADWKSNPIYLHLNRIIDAKLAKTESQVSIKAADELSKTKRHVENEKIINRNWVREIINKMLKEAGFPVIGKDEDPEKFIEKMKNADQKNERKAKKFFKSKKVAQMDDAVMNDIINSIYDDEGLALYQEYIYRTDSEIAVEEGAKYYLSVNKWQIIRDSLIKNLRNHNAYAVEFYTSLTTGTPVLENVDFTTDLFKTLPFKREDGMDCAGFRREYSVTYGTFVRKFGANLSKTQLIDIFNRTRGEQNNNKTYELCSEAQRENTKMRIGRAFWETQNMEVYRVGNNAYGNFVMNKKDENYAPPKGSPYKRENRFYNVWYECYYIPQSGQRSQITSDMVFCYQKVKDQQRFGEDGRMCKSPFILFRKNTIPPINEIIMRYMRIINLLWFRLQNDIGNDMPHTQVIVEEALSSIMESIDANQKTGKDASAMTMRMLRQTGKAVMKIFGKNPNQVIQKPVIDQESGYIKSATEKLIMIGELYNQMTLAIGINDVSEGKAPEPRQALGAIQLAGEAGNNARYFLEEAMLNCNIELLYRFLYYFHDIVNDGDKDRVEELENIVGETNSKALSGIKDIPFHSLGIYVDSTDLNALKQQVMEMAISEYKRGAMAPEDYLFLIGCENIKKAMAVLRLKLKKRQKEIMDQKDKEFAQTKELQQLRIKEQQAMIQFQALMKDQNILTQGKVDERLTQIEALLQTKGAAEIKSIQGQNKVNEMLTQDQIDMKNKMIEA